MSSYKPNRCGRYPCKSVLGSCHQASIGRGRGILEWEVGGTQCTVIALAALIFSSFTGPDFWTTSTVDNILREGDVLYRFIIDRYHRGNHSQLLGALDLPGEINVFGSSYILEYHSTVYGIIGHAGNPDFDLISLEYAIESLTLECSHMIITVNGQSFAIFTEDDHFYLFDSHARNHLGEPDANGFAALLCFTSMKEFKHYLEYHYANQRFDITAVNINKKNECNNAAQGCSVEKTKSNMRNSEYLQTESSGQALCYLEEKYTDLNSKDDIVTDCTIENDIRTHNEHISTNSDLHASRGFDIASKEETSTDLTIGNEKEALTECTTTDSKFQTSAELGNKKETVIDMTMVNEMQSENIAADSDLINKENSFTDLSTKNEKYTEDKTRHLRTTRRNSSLAHLMDHTYNSLSDCQLARVLEPNELSLEDRRFPCKSVLGSCHQASIGKGKCIMEWEVGGTQCTVIALVGLIFSSFTGPDLWTTSTVDNILREGDVLYRFIIDRYHRGNHSQLLGALDLPGEINIFESSYILEYHSTVYGIIGLEGNPDFNLVSLEYAIESLTLECSHMIITVNGQSFAIFTADDHFYLFDSHARNHLGEPDANRFAALLCFTSMKEFKHYLEYHYANQRFDITAVNINKKNECNNAAQGCSIGKKKHNMQNSLLTESSGQVLCYSNKKYKDLNSREGNVTDLTIGNKKQTEYTSTDSDLHASGGFDMASKQETNTDLTIGNEKQSEQIVTDSDLANKKDTFRDRSTGNEKQTTGHVQFSSTRSNSSAAYLIDHMYNCSNNRSQAKFLQQNELSLVDHTYALSLQSSGFIIAADESTPRSFIHNIHLNHSYQRMSSDTVWNNNKYLSNHTYAGPTLSAEANLYECNISSIGPVESVNNENDPITWSGQCQDYECAIRSSISTHCISCHRFLFENQVYHIGKVQNDVTQQLEIKRDSALCHTCLCSIRRNKVPATCMSLNKLAVNDSPEVLTCLSKIEKRLLALIQIFMMIIILPGGQYAEKGLVLNMPVDIRSVTSELPRFLDNATCFINFNASCSSPQYVINPIKVWNAFQWLKNNNHLYHNVGNNTAFLHTLCNRDEPIVNISDLEENALVLVNYSVPHERMEGESNYPSLQIKRSDADPVSVYEIPFGEEKAFPWLFPNGNNGYTFPRNETVHPSMYFRSRLYNVNPIWRHDLQYILHAAVSYDVMQLKQAIGVYLKMTPGHDGTRATASYVRSPENREELQKNSYMFMKKIRGTIAYYRNSLNDLLAMLRSLGPPTLFVTLSADDLHWPEIAVMTDGLKYDEACSKGTMFNIVQGDPLMATTHFTRRFSALLKHIINGDEKPFGSVRDYFIRVEFQNRGSPHYHMLFWIDGIPTEINSETTKVLKSYIEKVIHTKLPNFQSDPVLYGLVSRLQTHRHTKYCQPRPSCTCRFKFPKPTCTNTRILSHGEIIKRRGRYYETVRDQDSVYINAYNPTILKHWRANMDIQVVNNAESVAYYICSYICKSEPSELKTALTRLITNTLPQLPSLSLRQRLWKIGTTVLKHRRLSAQEAVFRLGSMPLVQVSRKIIYLNIHVPGKRYRMLRPADEIDNLPDNSTDIFLPNMLDYYRARPINMCEVSYYHFAAWYEKAAPLKNPNHHSALVRIYIPKYEIWLRKRRHSCIVRYPNFALNSEDYYYSMLMLLYPHRQECELIIPYSSVKESFVNRAHLFDHSVSSYFDFANNIDLAIRRIQLVGQELNESESECRNNIESNMDRESSSKLPLVLSTMWGKQNVGNDDNYTSHIVPACRMSPRELGERVESLTSCQLQAFNMVKTHFSSSTAKPLNLFISGAAGVGKSFLIETIIGYLQIYHPLVQGTSPVAVCAPTGTAARNIKGSTIHSLLKIPVEQYVNYEPIVSPIILKSLRENFVGVHTIIIDEISMVSENMFSIISNRLTEIFESDDPFGNLNIIVLGDLFQLRPVRGRHVFNNHALWRLFSYCKLTVNMRQATDKQYAQLLNRVRLGSLESDDINLLKSRLIDVRNSDIPEALHIYPTRKEVEQYNKQRQVVLDENPCVIPALHYFSAENNLNTNEVDDNFIPEDDQDAGSLPRYLHLSLGTRVMLIRNILTDSGLVNGVMGTVREIHKSSDNLMVLSVDVLFDNPSVGRMTSQDSHDPISIHRISHKYMIHGTYVTREQIPLVPAWACTVHKVQGATLSQVVINLGSSVFEDGMAYVALSRVSRLDGLHLTALNINNIRASLAVLEEYKRLRNVDKDNNHQD